MKSAFATLALAAALFGQVATAQTVHRLTLATGQPPVYPYISLLRDYFVPEVDKRLQGTGQKIEWTQGYAGSIMKIGSEVDSVRNGVVDVGFVLMPNNESKLPFHSYTYFVPFTSHDAVASVNAFNKVMRSVPLINETWQKNNHHHLATAAVDSYNLYAKRPITKVEELRGMKIGVIGPNGHWLRNTGAVSVTLNLAAIYNDLQSGIYDAILLPDSVAFSLKVHEVASYRMKYDFGPVVFGALTINRNRWAELPQSVRDVLTDVAKKYEQTVTLQMREKGSDGLAAMQKAGLKLVDPGDEGRKRWAELMPNIAQEWTAAQAAKSPSASAIVPAYLRALQEEGMKPARKWID